MHVRIFPAIVAALAVFAVGAGDLNQRPLWPSTVYGSMIIERPDFNFTDTLEEVAPGAIHRWDFTTGSGTTLTDLIGSLDGTLTNGATWNNGGMEFPNTNSVVNLGSIASSDAIKGSASQEISVIARFEVITASETTYGRFIGIENGLPSTDGWSLFLSTGNEHIRTSIDGVINPSYLTPSFSDGVTYIIGFSSDNGDNRVFRSGSFESQGNTGKAFPSTTVTGHIGNASTLDRNFTHTLVDLIVWDRALADEEQAAVAAFLERGG